LITEKQCKANRENGQKGGVRTKAGKNKVRYNARRHGVLSNAVMDYEGPVLTQFVDALYMEFSPVTFSQELLVERIAVNYLKLFRLRKAEDEYMQACLHQSVVRNLIPDIKFDEVIVEGYKPQIHPENVEKLVNIYQRYETAIENRIYRAMRELRDIHAGN
jgi:hypothetical protein